MIYGHTWHTACNLTVIYDLQSIVRKVGTSGSVFYKWIRLFTISSFLHLKTFNCNNNEKHPLKFVAHLFSLVACMPQLLSRSAQTCFYSDLQTIGRRTAGRLLHGTVMDWIHFNLRTVLTAKSKTTAKLHVKTFGSDCFSCVFAFLFTDKLIFLSFMEKLLVVVACLYCVLLKKNLFIMNICLITLMHIFCITNVTLLCTFAQNFCYGPHITTLFNHASNWGLCWKNVSEIPVKIICGQNIIKIIFLSATQWQLIILVFFLFFAYPRFYSKKGRHNRI